MWTVSFVFFWVWVAAVVVAIWAGIVAWRFGMRLPRVVEKGVLAGVFPRVAVILPIKGVDDDTHANIQALLDQDYPEYRLIFTAESDEDPVVGLLEKMAREDSRIEIVIAGLASNRGQKVHNQLAAVERTTEHDEVLAFMDADARPNPNWLRALVAPLMLVVALLIRRDSRGPAFFRQERVGIDMRSFTLLKFRTMREDTDHAPHREYLREILSADAAPGTNDLYKLDRSDVVTRVGKLLRRTSLDELPQLVNVLKGDMSLVGPRPAIPYELELYAPHHFERFLVPAGLTGLWQVEARAHSTFGEALDLDVIYARSWSLGLDLRLLLRTPLLMLRNRETG